MKVIFHVFTRLSVRTFTRCRMILVLADRPGTKLYIGRSNINILSITTLSFRKVALAQALESHTGIAK